MQRAIAARLNPLFKIYDVVVAEALPRTASNKVMRRVLRDNYAREDQGGKRSNPR
jgi:acetyl-CoA synthetase